MISRMVRPKLAVKITFQQGNTQTLYKMVDDSMVVAPITLKQLPFDLS